MAPRRRKKKIYIVKVGNTPINLLQMGAVTLVLLILVIAPIVWWTGREEPPIDLNANLKSKYFTDFSYPFESEEQRQAFAKDAYLMNSGAELYSWSPLTTKTYPSGYGKPLMMSVFFPADSLVAGSDASTTITSAEGKVYNCFRGLIVPRNQPQALQNTLSAFPGGRGSAANWSSIPANLFCFAEGTEPSSEVRLMDILGTYLINSARANLSEPVGFNYAVILVGHVQPVSYDQVSASARSILQHPVVFQRGKLRVLIDRVELAPNSTRVHVVVENGTDETETWNWNTNKTFLFLDNVDFVEPQDQLQTGAGGIGTEDLLANTFSPGRTEGYLFFERISQPQKSLQLKIADPADAASSEEITFSLQQLLQVPAGKRRTG